MVAKVKLDWSAITGMTRGVVQDHVSSIAARAGEGFVGDVIQGGGSKPRPHGAVRAETMDAKRRNARENTLLKAVY